MRLKSLDLMRGCVMLFLTVIQPILLAWVAYNDALGMPTSEWIRQELNHMAWSGWTLWDLVMPTFIFMCGVAIPFALPKYLTPTRLPTHRFFLHLLYRVSTLWLLGMMIQGNLLTLQWDKFFFFTNTLQAIAMGYLLTAFAFLIPWRAVRFALPFVFMALYALLLEDHGGYLPTSNFAYTVEQAILPGLQDDPKYTWILTSLMFSAMTMLGAMCGEILKLEKKWQWKSIFLGALGLGLFLTGQGLSLVIPVIKPIYTVSFTAIAMGIAILVLAFLYTLVDGLKKSFNAGGIVTIFGQYALVAYVLHEFLFGLVLRPLGLRFSEWAYYYYIAQEDATLHVKAIPAYQFMGATLGCVFLCIIVYFWASYKRMHAKLNLLQKERAHGNE